MRSKQKSWSGGATARVFAVLAFTAVSLACGGSTGSTPSQAPADAVKVITGSGVALGQFYAMMLVGVDQGFFKKYNIDPTFTEGTGSGTSAQQIANGQYDFGIEIGAAALIAAVARGATIKMVCQDSPVAPVAVLSVAPKQIKKPQDLIGKTIGLPPGTTQANIFPAFLKANNLDASQMKIVSTPLTGIQVALVSGRLDGYVSYAQSNIPILRSMNANDPYAMKLADFGFKLSPDAGIVTTNDMIKNKPDVVRRFVAAIEDSINYTLNGHINEACSAAAKLFANAIKTEICQQQTTIEVENIKAYRAAGKPITWMDDKGWQAQIDALTTYGGIPKFGTTTDYYTNRFVPGQK